MSTFGKLNLRGAAPRLGSADPAPTTELELDADQELDRERLLRLLKTYWYSPSAEAEVIELHLATLGQPCLVLLKDVALDRNLHVDARKGALCCLTAFNDKEIPAFLNENFVSGKDPAELYQAFNRGDMRAGREFALYRQAVECLETYGLDWRSLQGEL